jgi:hypothetical protein
MAILATAALGGCGHTPAKSAAPPNAVAAAPAASPAASGGSSSHWYWPFGHRAAPAPQPVEELVVQAVPGSAAEFLQFWERNTLVVDMRSASGTGSATLTPRAHTLWPVRLAFRVLPGRIGQLEVRGAERTVFNVAASGAAPVDLRLGPNAYTARTSAITVAWGPAPAVAAP